MKQKSFYFLFSFLCICILSIVFYLSDLFYFKKKGYPLFVKRPFFSIVVTSYNYARYLPQTLDSIVAQTYKNYEVIIVDDGSQDDSVEIIKKYTEKYPNFHLYQHEGGINKGFVETMKFGISKTKGKYVTFLESDDYWTPDNLMEKIKFIYQHSEPIIVSNDIFLIDDKENPIEQDGYINLVRRTLKEKNPLESIDEFFCYIPTLSAATIKKDILNNINLDTPIPAFLDWWIYKQIRIKYPLYYIKKQLSYWRKHSDSYNNAENHAKNMAQWDVFLAKIKKLVYSEN